MKNLFLLLALFVSISCETKKQSDQVLPQEQAEASEPTPQAEQVGYQEFAEEAPDYESDDSLQTAITAAIGEAEAEANARSLYHLSTDFSGYENGTAISFHFDSLFEITYYTIDWNMEGMGGTASYFFEGGNLIAGREHNDNTGDTEEIFFHSDFEPVSGFNILSEAEGNPQITTLARSDIDKRQTEVNTTLQSILIAMRENIDSLETTEYSVSFHSESTQDYGEPFTSTQDFTMDRELFDFFIKDED